MSQIQDIAHYTPHAPRMHSPKLTLRDALKMGAQVLADAGIESAPLDARLLLLHSAGCSNESIISHPDKPLAEEQLHQYLQLLARRADHEPIAYITQRKSFWSLDFRVTCDTLIPRPDSETLIELSLHLIKDRSKPSHIVDLGTGSGCLLLSLLSELPSARGTGVDMSIAALRVAKQNADELGFSNRTEFLQSNWCEGLKQKADIIIANPPYIAHADMSSLQKSVSAFEPHSALTDGADGLGCYREIARQAKEHLNPDGFCLVELGFGQALDVQEIFRQEGWNIMKTLRDLAGIERAMAVCHNDKNN